MNYYYVDDDGDDGNAINMTHQSQTTYVTILRDDGEMRTIHLDVGIPRFSTLTFPTPQTVSADFYAWFTAAFTKQS